MMNVREATGWAVGGLFLAVVYLGIGLFFHELLIGGNIDVGSAWSWVALLGWPLVFAAGIVCLCLLMAAIGLVLGAAYGVYIGARWAMARLRGRR